MLCGDKNPMWNGGKTKMHGYEMVRIPGHPRTGKHGYVREHIVVAEHALGKPLPTGATVHHVNGVKDDNRNCNLVICQDESYHQILHRRMRAKAECGHASWRKCKYCKESDDPENLYITPNGYNAKHRKCHSEYMKKFRNAKKSNKRR